MPSSPKNVFTSIPKYAREKDLTVDKQVDFLRNLRIVIPFVFPVRQY